jgi:hypothetical protein
MGFTTKHIEIRTCTDFLKSATCPLILDLLSADFFLDPVSVYF